MIVGLIGAAVAGALATNVLQLRDPDEQTPDGEFVENMPDNTAQLPVMASDAFAAEAVATGFSLPTSMAFVEEGSVIVLEKNTGIVSLASLDDSTKKELLALKVAGGAEQGLLGVAVADMAKVAGSGSDKKYVFLYLTEADANGFVQGNRVYRYEWDAANETLVNPVAIVRLSAEPGPTHNGGKMVFSDEGHLYVVIGNLNREGGPLQNSDSGTLEDICVILRVDIDGNPVDDNPFVAYGRESLSKYYAYGIRNSFGMDIDPLTGTLWDTENGESSDDEINVVQPGFNSGWSKVMGPIADSQATEADLFFLEGAHYRDPVFSWEFPIGVTDIEFLTSDRLGAQYENGIFIGDINGGALYFFELNESRDGLALGGVPEFSDRIANTYDEGFLARFGSFPGGITEIETGPDGYLYVMTFGGQIYRVGPS
ncbi:PQQ-dependent sugar dehydrogenase [Candidatus Nitrososphaera sp. FF02]|uniref:PQQ-dependent sugar dehydrogenase n=1 Tax=Candidatus Nitrososphaera sp. FF02 TaxID=3398226 RepID=UPI0039ECA0B5